MRVVLVEDDLALSMGIEYALQAEGYEVEKASTVKSARELFETNDFRSADTFAIFDVMLPDGTGFDLIKLVRERGINLPIIFLTAVSDEANIVQGLELGADDYITKPFRVKELMSRIKAVTRRYKQSDSQLTALDGEKLEYRNIVIHTGKAACYIRDGENEINANLTSNEYKLLLYFVRNRGIVLERKSILERLFDNQGNYVDDNTLSVYIKRLREKIGDSSKENPYIKTVRGIGYILE